MEISFNLKERVFCVNFANGVSFRKELNILAMFLVCNLFATITWLLPSAHKKEWIEEIQNHLDMAEDVEFESKNITYEKETKKN